MAQRHLTFRLTGVMAGFGAPSTGAQRRGAPRLPRSAVFGVIHASLGLDRRAVTATHPMVRGLEMVVAHNPPRVMTDYQTAVTPKKDIPVLSWRDYQTDWNAMAVLWDRDEAVPGRLDAVADALAHPVWTPYLGRRSCPMTAPCAARIVTGESLKHVLEEESQRHGIHLQGAGGRCEVTGDLHPRPGLAYRELAVVPDRPATTIGDLRTFEASTLYRYEVAA